jgi:hypothetical protein
VLGRLSGGANFQGREPLAWPHWSAIYRHTGFQWEAIKHLEAPNGAGVYSLRLSQKVRALSFREGDLLRFVSLHPDHDSAYRR